MRAVMMIAQAFAIIFIGLPFLTTSEAHVVFEEFGTAIDRVAGLRTFRFFIVKEVYNVFMFLFNSF